jgi:hypothetical protein
VVALMTATASATLTSGLIERHLAMRLRSSGASVWAMVGEGALRARRQDSI